MKKIALWLSLAGLAFSGYLSGIKFFSSTCAFGESCPYFLGYPACYYGLGLFLLLTTFSTVLVWGKGMSAHWIIGGVATAGAGILFAGYFSISEFITASFPDFERYTFGVPTCSLGLVFYVILFYVFLSIKRSAASGGAADQIV